jgi:hypothetical protein
MPAGYAERLREMLTPDQFLKKAAEDKERVQKASLDHADVITQHDNLAKKIIADLSLVVSDFDTLQAIEDLIQSQGKENAQIINSLLSVRIVGNISTAKGQVQGVIKMIVER